VASRRRSVEVVELDDRARRAIARRHPEVAGFGNAMVIAASNDIREPLARAIAQLAQAVNNGERMATERLVEALTPTVDVPKPDVLESARKQALQRTRILRDFGALTANDIASMAGSSAGNRSQVAYRWRKEQRVFGVPHRGATYYLAFQFDDEGQPLPVIAEVLGSIGRWEPWDIATWFVRPNGLLQQRPPVEVLLTSPAEVIATAHHDATH